MSVGVVHFEPLGIFPENRLADQLADGAEIAVPNDTNEARALILLEKTG
ncbi:MAG: MetQ/NlpA family ABC transporter substrate-binding protein [Oscillospiraceae bacterium]